MYLPWYYYINYTKNNTTDGLTGLLDACVGVPTYIPKKQRKIIETFSS